VYWYSHWSGRFSFAFLMANLHSLGSEVTAWLPGLTLALWLVGVAILVRRAFRSIDAWLAWGVGAVVLASTLAGTPNVYQSVYWETGSATYVTPMILGVFYVGWLLHDQRLIPASRWAAGGGLAVSGLWAFLAGGFSETYVAVQTAGLLLLLLAGWQGGHRRWGRIRGLLWAGLAGSVAAMVLIAAAPGSQVRQSLMPAPPGVVDLLRRSLVDEYIFAARALKEHPTAIAFSVLWPAAAALAATTTEEESPSGKRSRLARWAPVLLIPAATGGLVLAAIVPHEYAVSTYPEARVLVIPQFVLTLGLGAWGWTLGRRLRAARIPDPGRSALRPALAFSLLAGAYVLVTLAQTRSIWQEIPAARDYAVAWQARHTFLNSDAARSVGQPAAASLRHMGGLAELSRNPDEWINRCVAWTYGLEGVIAK
jgi:hypothetical protein